MGPYPAGVPSKVQRYEHKQRRWIQALNGTDTDEWGQFLSNGRMPFHPRAHYVGGDMRAVGPSGQVRPLSNLNLLGQR